MVARIETEGSAAGRQSAPERSLRGPDSETEEDLLHLAGLKLRSRLILGSARYPNHEVLLRSLCASETEFVTVAVRRLDIKNPRGENLLGLLRQSGVHLLPNTAGCYTVRDALLTAELAREALGTERIKLELIADKDTLYPDVEKLLQAARELVRRGFTVLPYSIDDPISCQRLEDLGCAAVMPLGSPIGSGMGILNPYNLSLIRERVRVPLIVDAGIGTASDVALAMEAGCDAVLVNTAVAQAERPVRMARAMALASQAGRLAWRAGRIPRRRFAQASSSQEGRIAASD